MFSNRNWRMVLVGGAATKTTAGDNKFPENLNTGEIGVFRPGGGLYSEDGSGTTPEADTRDPFFIALKDTDSKIKKTDVIEYDDIVSVHLKVGAADAEQISYVGYNGSTGSLEAINDNLYRIRMSFQEGFANNDHGTSDLKHAIYKSDSSAVQSEIALGLAKSGFYNFSKEPKNSSGLPRVLFKAISNDAGVAMAADAGADYTHLTFSFGSKFVTGTDSAGIAVLGTDEVEATIVANDFLRAGTAVTDDVYKVIAITAGTATTPLMIELDRPFGAATTSIAIGSTEYIAAALGAAANWGVAITGQADTFSANASEGVKLKFKKVVFDTTLDGFGTSTLTDKSTAASLGTNTWELVTQDEIYHNGNNGEFFRKGQPNLSAWTLQTLSTNDPYDSIEIVYQKSIGSDLIGANNKTRKSVVIYLPATAPNYAITGTANDITDVLEELCLDKPVYNATKNGEALVAGDLAIS